MQEILGLDVKFFHSQPAGGYAQGAVAPKTVPQFGVDKEVGPIDVPTGIKKAVGLASIGPRLHETNIKIAADRDAVEPLLEAGGDFRGPGSRPQGLVDGLVL